MARPWIAAITLVVLTNLTVWGQENFNWSQVSVVPCDPAHAANLLPWDRITEPTDAPNRETQGGYFDWQKMTWAEGRSNTFVDSVSSNDTRSEQQSAILLAPTAQLSHGAELIGQNPELVSSATELLSREPELLSPVTGSHFADGVVESVNRYSPIQEAQAIAASFTDPPSVSEETTPQSPLDAYEQKLENQPLVDNLPAIVYAGETKLALFQTSPNEEIILKPLRNITKSDTAKSVHPEVNLQRFTGPLSTTDQLFSDLKIHRRFQDVAQLTHDECQHEHAHQAFTWASPNMYHQPLYFEQVNLERYGIGHRPCMQPLFSGLHFYGSVLMLPYKMYRLSPHECVYTLGHQRPGDAVCYQRHTALGQSLAK